MAITSVGYDGSINESQWAIMAPYLGLPYWVAEADALKGTIVTNADRTLKINAGRFGGAGVMDILDTDTDIQFDPVTSGSRYDLVTARRNWQGDGGVTDFQIIKGGTTKALPPFNRNPGILDDQLLFLVRVVAGQTRLGEVIDLRGLGMNGRAMVYDALAMEGYNNWPGFQIQVGREEYTLQANRTWVRTGLIAATSPAYRLRLFNTKEFKFGRFGSIGGGWKTSGDNSMGIKVLSNGKIQITKAGIYTFSTDVYRYYDTKYPQGTFRFRMAGLWVKPTYEAHFNAGSSGIEQALNWTGTLNVGDTIDFQFAQYVSDRSVRTWNIEIQIEMVA